MSNREKQENEMKLVGGYNNQLKYSDCSMKDTIKKILCILDILEISYGEMKTNEQVDCYFDTDNLKILKENGSLRTRRKNKSKVLILNAKSRDTSKSSYLPDNLIRKEEEMEIPFGQTEKEINEMSRRKFGVDSVCEQLKVINLRHTCEIETDVCKYELSYDKYTYINTEDNSESNDFYEIEIELNQNKLDVDNKDKKIEKLASIFKNILGFVSDQKSKYQRGMEWKNKKIDYVSRIFVVFDIVKYSTNTSIEQRRKIEKLTNFVKKELSSTDSNIFPIGDGMIISLPEEFRVFPFLHSVTADLKKFNENTPRGNHIHMRSSIHIGRVVPYTDINGRKNYAGHGINIACRINSHADKNQILVSEEFYQYMKDKDLANETEYSDKMMITVKHGLELAVRNYQNEFIGIKRLEGV